jgi:predicted metal-dependent phosphoesterase TrpH
MNTGGVMRLVLDLHVHSRYSRDCNTSIEEIVEGCGRSGLDGYAITDHDTIQGIPEALQKNKKLIVIPGLEVSAKGAHLLALGVKENIPSGLSIKETVSRIHDQDATAILAHPYGLPRSWISYNRIHDAGLDAVEVANSSQIPYSIIFYLNSRLARRLGLPGTGGSDSHIPDTLGRCYTVINTISRGLDDILKAIRIGKTEVYGERVSIKERLKKLWGWNI